MAFAAPSAVPPRASDLATSARPLATVGGIAVLIAMCDGHHRRVPFLRRQEADHTAGNSRTPGGWGPVGPAVDLAVS